jgi:Spy/CpxP family protein refolding chaperone
MDNLRRCGMKRLALGFALISLFAIVAIAYAQEPGWRGGGMMGPGMEGGGYGMGTGMMGCQQMGQGRGGMMGMARERMGHHKRWFQCGVSLMLQNADKLGLSDEQIKNLYDIKRKYSKDIIKQDAEMKIAEIDLGALLKESEINLSEIKEALKKVENTKTQIRYLRIMAFVEARKILTDEQKNSLKKLMQMRAAPGMKRMMSSPEPEEEGEEETPEE